MDYRKMDNTMNNAAIGNYSTSSIDTYLQSGVMNDDLFWSLMKIRNLEIN